MRRPYFTALLIALLGTPALAQTRKTATEKIDTHRGDQMFAAYFRHETAKLATSCLENIHTLDDWTSRRVEYRRQLFEMLGLDPLPPARRFRPRPPARSRIRSSPSKRSSSNRAPACT